MTSHRNVEVVHRGSWDIHLSELAMSVTDFLVMVCLFHVFSWLMTSSGKEVGLSIISSF